jgi:CBS domain-containing membrane protein
MIDWREFLGRFRPEAASVSWREQGRSALTAAVGVLVAVSLSAWLLPTPPFVVAAVGASAVLVFALPASPLAQPWSVVGSYLVSALAGVAMAHYVPSPAWASALAVAGAILAMLLARCLHPPGGAVALFAVLGGEPVTALGFGYVLSPVLANAVLLVAAALVINNLVPGRRYPRPHPELNPHQTRDPEPLSRLGLRHQDLKAALEQYGRPLYISGEELDAVIQLAERQAWRRRFGEMTCGDVMTRDLVTVRPEASLAEAWRLLRQHQLVGMPVVDGERRMVGCVTLDDFVRSAKARTPGGLRQRLWSLLKGRGGAGGRVADLMRWHAEPVPAVTPLAELVPRMTRRTHQVPVTDGDGRLIGIVTQSDLIGALYHGRLAEAA